MRDVLMMGSLMVLLALGVYAVIANARLEWGCIQYLKRAADASTPALALGNLDTAIAYLGRYGLTVGSTAMFFDSPEDDVGYWYANLRTLRDEISRLPADAPRLEVAAMSVRVREVILDSGSRGMSVTMPNGLATHPYNAFCLLIFCLACIAMVVSQVVPR